MRLSLLWLLTLAVVPSCLATAPVLGYSLKFGGSRQHTVTAAAVDSDGSVYITGWTNSSDFPKTRETPSGVSERSPDIFVTRLAPDGGSIMCSVVIGGSSDDYANAIALGPAGSVYVLGSTASSNFPITAGSPARDWTLFLMRLDPCDGRILSSTLFLPYAIARGLAVDRAGNALVAAQWSYLEFPGGFTPIDAKGLGVVLRIDPSGRQLASARIPDDPRAIAVGPDDSVYIAGGASIRAPFAAKLDSTLQSAVYLRRLGAIEPSAIAVDDAGRLYLTGSGGSDFAVTGDAAFREPRSKGGVLLKLAPTGDVVYATYADLAPDKNDQRGGVAIALDRDAKVYVAVSGLYHLPDVGPAIDASWVSGIRVRAFAADGSPEDGDLFVPSDSNLGSADFAVAFDREGRAAVATSRTAAPVTPGSVAMDVPEPVSVLLVDYRASDAPALESDVDALRLLLISVGPDQVQGKTKPVHLTSSGVSAPVTIAIVPENQPGQPARQFSAPEQATTPAEIPIKLTGNSFAETLAVFAAPGLRGGFRILPLKAVSAVASFVTQIEGRLDVPSASSGPVSARMHVSAQAFTRVGVIEVSAPYQAGTMAPWLKIDNTSGVTPADLILTADPSGLSPGDYRGTVTFSDRLQDSNVTFTVGPAFRVVGIPFGPFTVPAGPPVDLPLRLTSSNAPIDFRITSVAAFLDFNPKTGVTPADVVLTVDPAKVSQPPGFFTIGGSNTGTVIYTVSPIVQSGTPAPPPPLSGDIGTVSPGALVRIQGFGQPCAPSEAAVPWPFELGGCSLRVKGSAIPIGAITASTFSVSSPLQGITLLAQLPYDLEGPTTQIELISAFPRSTTAIPIVAARPQLLFYGPPAFAPPWLRRADGSLSDRNNPVSIGEVVSLRISGYGRTDPVTPIGALPSEETPIRPVARIEAFIDGRRAEVLSAELSQSEVGVAVVRLRIPSIQADDHLFVLRMADAETAPAFIRVGLDSVKADKKLAQGSN